VNRSTNTNIQNTINKKTYKDNIDNKKKKVKKNKKTVMEQQILTIKQYKQ